MAFEQLLQTVSLVNGSGDLSSKQYYAVAPATSGAGYVAPVATRGSLSIGVTQDKSTAAGNSCQVGIGGIGKLACGDSSAGEVAISPGTVLVASSVGRGVPSTATGLHTLAIALDSLSTGAQAILTVRYAALGQLTS